jgi:hypothetical protein
LYLDITNRYSSTNIQNLQLFVTSASLKNRAVSSAVSMHPRTCNFRNAEFAWQFLGGQLGQKMWPNSELFGFRISELYEWTQLHLQQDRLEFIKKDKERHDGTQITHNQKGFSNWNPYRFMGFIQRNWVQSVLQSRKKGKNINMHSNCADKTGQRKI